ncbi:MAG TPA: DolP-mannose mannosyltransferase [Blastocatellia bacterium]|nr:DolP-mannose mannosyltransferase [Blastocatellia bacterium]
MTRPAITIDSTDVSATPEVRGQLRQVCLFFIAIVIFGTVVMLLYSPARQPEGGDSAGYDYIAQCILRGQLPYRDVIDIKAPGSMYLSAVAMAVGRLAGVSDVLSVRLFQSLLVGLLCGLILLIARFYFRNTQLGLIAAVAPLIAMKFAEWMVVGTQPKLPMIIFGVLTLLFIAVNRPWLAGASAMLACLCWQPGLMFLGVAVLIFSNYLRRWKDGAALKVVSGAAIPLLVVLGYFYARGALGDLWAWTITFNYSVFRPETQRTPLRALHHMWTVISRVYGADTYIWLTAAVGLVVYIGTRVYTRMKRGGDDLPFKDALAIPPLIYFAFCILNMQGGPDLIPFIPFVAILASWALVGSIRFCCDRLFARRSAGFKLDQVMCGMVLSALMIIALGRGIGYHVPAGFTLQDQEKQMSVLSEVLSGNDKVYVHGSVELLVLLKRPNVNPYTFLNQGIDRFESARRGIDLTALVDAIEAERPRLVALSRLKTVASQELLEKWVDEHYDKFDRYTPSDVYIRKPGL